MTNASMVMRWMRCFSIAMFQSLHYNVCNELDCEYISFAIAL